MPPRTALPRLPASRKPRPATPSPRAAGRLRPPARDIFLVDLDTFYVSVERVLDPSLHGKPVLVGGKPGERGVVACASYEARPYGIRAGMPLARAAQLAPPDAVFLHGDHRAYMRASKKVMEILRTFTPDVEAVSLDEAYLDMTGLARHHRSWRKAAQAIHDQVMDQTRLSISIGIGGTRAIAKIASNLAKPCGVFEVRRGEERAFLSALPLEVMPGVGPRLRKDLARFNLHTVGDLAEIPENVLEETFGVGGVLLSRRARGLESADDSSPIGKVVPKSRSISRETSFAKDTDDVEWIDGMISYLAQRATQALRKGGFLARSVGVRIRYSDFKTVDARRRLPRPSDSDDEILGIVRTLWRQRYDRRVRLRLVGVVLHDLEEVHDRQLALPFSASPASADQPVAYEPVAREGEGTHEEEGTREPVARTPADERIDRAIDRIRDRHGFGSLVRGRAVELFGRASHSKRGFRLHTPACSR